MSDAQEQSSDPSPRQTFWVGVGTTAFGVALVLLAADVIPQRWWPPNVPSWVLAVVGLVCVFAGAAVLVGLGTPASSACVALSMLMMAIAFLWIAFFGSARHMSGGIPLLPKWLNVSIGRFVFALAGLGFLALAWSAWRWSRRQADEEDR